MTNSGAKIPPAHELLSINASDLGQDLRDTMQWYGYVVDRAAKSNDATRRAAHNRDKVAGAFYLISKEDVLDSTGRAPSDTFIEHDLTQDEDWVKAKELYMKRKFKSEFWYDLMRGLELKLETLRTLIASERTDKQLHSKNN